VGEGGGRGREGGDRVENEMERSQVGPYKWVGAKIYGAEIHGAEIHGTDPCPRQRHAEPHKAI
jgi:hypothetical protein